MTVRAGGRRARDATGRWAVVLGCVVVLATACTSGTSQEGEPAGTSSAARPVSAPTMQPEDRVDLTVYFRSGEGDEAHLAPVTKETLIGDDLPTKALDLLIAGPWSQGGDLHALLPAGTTVRSLRVEGETAYVDLSREVLTEAGAFASDPANEVLALGAIAATLTEFPAIERVRLSVEGRQHGPLPGLGGDVGAFWGGWGLPQILVRDESMFAVPARGEGTPDLERFGLRVQRLGEDGEGEGVAVTSVRVRDRTTYLRLVVEVADPADPDADVGLPPVTARPAGGQIVLEIDGIGVYDADVAPGQRIDLEDPELGGVVVDDLDADGRLRAVVSAPHAPGYLLHHLTNPTRIVLDVRK